MTSPLFFIGYNPALSSWDTLMAIYHVNKWRGLTTWGINLLWHKTTQEQLSDGLLKPLEERFGFQLATSIDYLERWTQMQDERRLEIEQGELQKGL